MDLSFLKGVTPRIVVLGNLQAKDMEKDRNYTFVGDDGLYIAKQNGILKTVSKVTDISSHHLNSDLKVKEGFELLVPKIPFKYYMMCLNFFRDIHTKYGTEAGIVFYRVNEKTDLNYLQTFIDEGSMIIDDGLIIYCPIQKNSYGLHDIKGEEVYEYLRENSDRYVEVHSHHTIGCNWSGTDNDNMCHYQFFTVYRHIYRFEDTLTRYRFNNKFYDIKTSDIFDIPFIDNNGLNYAKELGITELKTSHAEYYPEEWLERSIKTGQHSERYSTYADSLGYTPEELGENALEDDSLYDNYNKFFKENVDVYTEGDYLEETNQHNLGYVDDNYSGGFTLKELLTDEENNVDLDEYDDNTSFNTNENYNEDNYEDEYKDDFETVNNFINHQIKEESKNKTDESTLNEVTKEVTEKLNETNNLNNNTEDNYMEHNEVYTQNKQPNDNTSIKQFLYKIFGTK